MSDQFRLRVFFSNKMESWTEKKSGVKKSHCTQNWLHTRSPLRSGMRGDITGSAGIPSLSFKILVYTKVVLLLLLLLFLFKKRLGVVRVDGGWDLIPWRSEHLACVKSKGNDSHHLRPGHGVLVRRVGWIPVAKTVHVSIWMHVASFVRHWNLPKLGQPRWAGRDGAAAVEMLFWSTAMFHDFFVFGSLVLEPYFHLKEIKPH